MWRCLSPVGLGEEVADEPPDTAGRRTCLGPGSSTSTPLQKKMDKKESMREKVYTVLYFV